MAYVTLYDKYGFEIEHLTQWDINVKLRIHNFDYDIAPVCHFANRFDKTAKTVTSTLNNKTVVVDVPNILLTKSDRIDMYVFLYDSEEDTGRTLYKIELPVMSKPKPDDYEYSDNVEIIELSELRVKLESLVARAEEAIGVKIDNLENTYNAKIQEIKDGISEDVRNLNQQIINNNTGLVNRINESVNQLNNDITSARENLSSSITNARTNLTNDIQFALTTLINGIQDGSPKGIFSNVSELQNKNAGLYLLVDNENADNGYIFYWDGETLSDRLLYYAGIVVNNGTITYDKLADDVKKRYGVVLDYVLSVNSWENNVQVVDVSNNYTVTNKTMANVVITDEANEQMLSDDCSAIYITTNEEHECELLAHYIGNAPTDDITIQITLVETY